MIRIGELYQYVCVWNTAVYFESNEGSIFQIKNMFTSLRQRDIVLILKESHCYDSPCWKILTSKGDVGWVVFDPKYLVRIQE